MSVKEGIGQVVAREGKRGLTSGSTPSLNHLSLSLMGMSFPLICATPRDPQVSIKA